MSKMFSTPFASDLNGFFSKLIPKHFMRSLGAIDVEALKQLFTSIVFLNVITLFVVG